MKKTLVGITLMLGLAGCGAESPLSPTSDVAIVSADAASATVGVQASGAMATNTLTLVMNAPSSSRVTVSGPNGFRCVTGQTCTGSFASGSTITLQGRGDKRVKLAGWAGACGPLTCTLTFVGNLYVQANFY